MMNVRFVVCGLCLLAVSATAWAAGPDPSLYDPNSFIAADVLSGSDDVSVGNDADFGPYDVSVGSSVLEPRNRGGRRRFAFVKFELSELGTLAADEVFGFTALNVLSNSSGNHTVTVYGIKERLDDFDLTSTSYATAPGVMNDPLPALDTPVEVDEADVIKLLEFPLPDDDTRGMTDYSDALADFINSDEDGHVVLMFATLNDGDSAWMRSKDYGGTSYTLPVGTGDTSEYDGVVLVTQVVTPTWATKPSPNLGASEPGATMLSWNNPPYPSGTLTCDVYLGSTADRTLMDKATVTNANSVAINTTNFPTFGDLGTADPNTYYWYVDVTDSGTGTTIEGNEWTFDTFNVAPIVAAGDDQYLWLDPTSATAVIDATVTDDGLPNGTLTYLWEQMSGPTVTLSPNDVEDISPTFTEAGTYVLRLTASDGAESHFDEIMIFVGADACEAAQAAPGYSGNGMDFNDDCFVNLIDFAEFAAQWLDCTSFVCP